MNNFENQHMNPHQINDNISVPSPNSDAIIEAGMRKHEEWREQRRQKIEEMKQSLPPDKEILDINQFAKLYDLTNDNNELMLSSNTIETLEEKYYLTYPNIKSMKEFAELMEYFDAHASN